MASAVKSTLSTHLKPSNGDEAEFVKKHHGKTRSHMVRVSTSLQPLMNPRLALCGISWLRTFKGQPFGVGTAGSVWERVGASRGSPGSCE